jgi:hypothetical protein
MVQYSVVSIIILHELLQGSTWTGWVITYIPWSKRYFRNNDRVFPDDNVGHSWNCLVMVWRAWRWTSTYSPASIIARFDHWTSLVRFAD